MLADYAFMEKSSFHLLRSKFYPPTKSESYIFNITKEPGKQHILYVFIIFTVDFYNHTFMHINQILLRKICM